MSHPDDTRLFERVDSEAKAYLLGWLAARGEFGKNRIELSVSKKDAAITREWWRVLGLPVPDGKRSAELVTRIEALDVIDDIRAALDVATTGKAIPQSLPRVASAALAWSSLRGIVDACAKISTPGESDAPSCRLRVESAKLRKAILSLSSIRATERETEIEWRGNDALDLLAKLYDGSTWALPRKRRRYLEWCMTVPSFMGARPVTPLPVAPMETPIFRFVRSLPEAVAPSKARASDSGYDLTIVKLIKNVGLVFYFDTGIKVQPPYGWYFDVVARSSLTKTGFILANGVGVIDRTYTGSIIVPLMKVDTSAPDLTLPARVAQMIPRPIVHAQLVEVPSLSETDRGAGGFGST